MEINKEKLTKQYTRNAPDRYKRNGFSKVLHSVLLDKRLSHPAFKVYCVLLMYTFDKKECCYPSLSSIAKDSKYTRNTVILAIRELEKLGYVRVERALKNSRKVNKYFLLIKDRS